MADIAYKCPKCAAERMVSEFAAPDKILCGQCGVNMLNAANMPAAPAPAPTPNETTKQDATDNIPPAPMPTPQKGNKLKLARAVPESPPQETAPPAKIKSKTILPPEDVRAPLELHPKKKVKKKLVSHSLLSFLLFIVVGGIAYFLRYGGIIDEEMMAKITPWSWAGVLFLHVLIILKALTSDMMQGILCLLVPGWSFVYLILSDHFWHKAIIFGLLIAVGYDGGLQLSEYALSGLQAVQEFINTGGGDVRRH